MEKIYRAVKYMRTSCPDNEVEYRDSIANQSKLIDGFIRRHPEIMVVAEKMDNGFSGLFYDRPAFKEMIADIESGQVDCIIVKDLSRIGRDYIETGRYLRDFFPAYKVRLISVDDNIDSVMLDGFEKTIALIKSIFSERYSHDVSVKTRSSLDAKRRQGEFVGAIPIYGYQKSADNKNKLIADPNTLAVVQSIFTMTLQGMSAEGIATTLNNQGIFSPLAYKRNHGMLFPTGGFADKNNAKWSATTVFRILRDENYTGTLVQGRQRSLNYKTKIPLTLDECEWVKVENSHPAIITKADYDAVQRVLAMDTRAAPGKQLIDIFSGMLICGCCGKHMTRKTVNSNGKQYIYYCCPTGKNNGCHSPYRIRKEELIKSVTLLVKERIFNIQRLHNPTADCIGIVHQKNYTLAIAELDQKTRDLGRFRSSLYDNLSEGIISTAEFESLQNYYDSEIASLDAEKSALHKRAYNIEETILINTAWKQIFLQYIQLVELDRLAVVKMIQGIRIDGKDEIVIDFVYQSEYDQALLYSEQGGHNDG